MLACPGMSKDLIALLVMLDKLVRLKKELEAQLKLLIILWSLLLYLTVVSYEMDVRRGFGLHFLLMCVLFVECCHQYPTVTSSLVFVYPESHCNVLPPYAFLFCVFLFVCLIKDIFIRA